LLATLKQTVGEAVDKMMGENEQRIKEAKRSYKIDLKRFAPHEKPWNRPERYTEEYVERRSIAIIRCLGRGNSTPGRMAVAFYCDLESIENKDRKTLLEMYEAMDASEHRKQIRRYNNLLNAKGLKLEKLKDQAGTDKSLRAKSRK
jgi:hypothetical protein